MFTAANRQLDFVAVNKRHAWSHFYLDTINGSDTRRSHLKGANDRY